MMPAATPDSASATDARAAEVADRACPGAATAASRAAEPKCGSSEKEKEGNAGPAPAALPGPPREAKTDDADDDEAAEEMASAALLTAPVALETKPEELLLLLSSSEDAAASSLAAVAETAAEPKCGGGGSEGEEVAAAASVASSWSTASVAIRTAASVGRAFVVVEFLLL